MNRDAQAWKQQLFDWEKTARCADVLERHLRLAGMCEADRKLVVAVHRHGQSAGDSARPRSVLRATQRVAAQQAGLSLGGLNKAKGRLEKAGLLAYRPGMFVVSWSRVWALVELADPGAELDDLDSDGGAAFTPVHACSRPYQEQRSIDTPNPKYQPNQDARAGSYEAQEARPGTRNPRVATRGHGSSAATGGHGAGHGEPVAIGAVVCDEAAGDVQAAIARQHAAQLDRLAERILAVVGPLEARHATPDGERLSREVARRIAGGIVEDEDGFDEFRGIVASMRRCESFGRSPGAYFVRCAQRRRWIDG